MHENVRQSDFAHEKLSQKLRISLFSLQRVCHLITVFMVLVASVIVHETVQLLETFVLLFGLGKKRKDFNLSQKLF